VYFAVISCFAMVSLAHAGEHQPDKFRLEIANYSLSRYDSSMSMTSPDLGAGIAIRPEDTLGIDIESSVLRIRGFYRFQPNHLFTYSYYKIDSNGENTLERSIDWVDLDGNPIIIPIGAQTNSRLETEIFKIGYLWSFHHSDKVELGIGAGLHITRVKVNLDSNIIIPASSSVERVDTTVPLPVVTLVLQYKVTPKFHWFLRTEAFALQYDNYTGSFRDTNLGVEYRAWKHVALGAGVTSSSLEIEEDDSEFHFKLDRTISGGLVYLAMYF